MDEHDSVDLRVTPGTVIISRAFGTKMLGHRFRVAFSYAYDAVDPLLPTFRPERSLICSSANSMNDSVLALKFVRSRS
jgi:hypothetical protein